ncbi:Six-hairpin glycosidase-like protein [Xylariales sp. AK1849]|nr:Six-hairpin glycosidase-like protein [Xylariales sp. AK1849]
MADSPFLAGQAKWIWVPDFDDAAAKGQFVLFRKTFRVKEKATDDILLHVSADTRYRLYLNGKRVSFGPCKSYLTHWNYETVNIAPFLREGNNVLAAKVLRFSTVHDGCLSMVRSALPGFILHCELSDMNLHSDVSWKAKKDDAVQLVPDSEWDYRLGPQFLSLSEKVDGRLMDRGWNLLGHDDSHWQSAILGTPQRKLSPMLDARRLFPRQIPSLPEIVSRFDGIVTSEGPVLNEAWLEFIKHDRTLEVPAHAEAWVELESRTLTTGFLDLICSVAGELEASPTIQILCSECYEFPQEQTTTRTKGDRTDFRRGKLYGMTDTYLPHNGNGHYSPFWFRTFRYIRLTITTKSNPLTLNSFTYRSTHYPLNIRTTLTTSSSFITKLWDISINTLKNCMHETYEDCPFYEQNQFAMDTRSQILFTYLLSRDDRLARKAMQEFYASRREDGLVEAHFPCPGRGINIPTFSLFWVLMVYDHMVHFGDQKLVKTYIGAVDGVLEFFDTHINRLGLVGQFDVDCWAFVDWVDGWFTPGKGFTGLAVPKAYFEKGAATFHSLVYAYTLLKASELQTFLGRHDTAKEYISRQQALIQAVKEHCFDSATGFFLDGPDAIDERSQHVQVLAVLSGCISGPEGQELMRRTVFGRVQHRLAKASLAMGFYVFRAVSEVGMYEECWDTLIKPWKKMIGDNLTTWAESESMMRSDCHGWSAVPLWEIGTEILGVQQRCKAYLEKVKGEAKGVEVHLEPRKRLIEDIKADVLIGNEEMIHVEWHKGSSESA